MSVFSGRQDREKEAKRQAKVQRDRVKSITASET